MLKDWKWITRTMDYKQFKKYGLREIACHFRIGGPSQANPLVVPYFGI